MGQMTTPKERVSTLRERLSGRVPTIKRRKNRSAPHSNPMFTAALHAAARCSNGAELSVLETRLVDMMKICSTDDEIAEYGKIYTEMKLETRSQDSSANYLGVALQMDQDTSYTEADMIIDAQTILPEALKRPENKFVDITAAGAINGDGCVDSEEYISALTGAGSGVTIITAPEPLAVDNRSQGVPVPLSYEDNLEVSNPADTEGASLTDDTGIIPSFRLVFQRFKCHRQQSDAFLGSKNEVYWSVAAGADSRAQNSFKTGEYGSIESGDVRNMNVEYFKGAVQTHFAGHIKCWEADDSGGGFYDAMIRTMRDIAKFSIDAAVNATDAADTNDGAWESIDGGETGTGTAIMALVSICSALVAELLAWLMNDDDLVFRREIAFTRAGLDAWTRLPNGEMSFMFDGGSQGKHELWVTCARVPHPDGTLRCIKYVPGSGWLWGSPAPAGKSPHGMTLASFRGDLVGVFQDQNDENLYWSKYQKTSQSWTPPRSLGYHVTSHRPALCVLNNRLFCLYRGTPSGAIYLTSTADIASWTAGIDVGGGARTSDGPAICSYNGYLLAVVRGNDNFLYFTKSTNNGNNWSEYIKCNSYRTLGSPALCIFDGYPHLAHYDVNGKLYIAHFDGSRWQSFKNIGNEMNGGPAIAMLNNRLHVLWQIAGQGIAGREREPRSDNWTSTYAWMNTWCVGESNLCEYEGELWSFHGLARMI